MKKAWTWELKIHIYLGSRGKLIFKENGIFRVKNRSVATVAEGVEEGWAQKVKGLKEHKLQTESKKKSSHVHWTHDYANQRLPPVLRDSQRLVRCIASMEKSELSCISWLCFSLSIMKGIKIIFKPIFNFLFQWLYFISIILM